MFRNEISDVAKQRFFCAKYIALSLKNLKYNVLNSDCK
jgi:hypothetical protein